MSVKKLVEGHGVNDADYPVTINELVSGKIKQVWRCDFYAAWKGIMVRCYNSKYQNGNPTYLGCSVDQEWMLFSSFKKWMQSQPWEGNQLDKDLLVPGNKIYGPDKCCFISAQLNKFTNERAADRGKFPLGVSYDQRSEKYLARCKNPFTGKDEFLGYFTDTNDGHEAWRKRKHEHACRYADMQTDPRIADALRDRYAISLVAKASNHARMKAQIDWATVGEFNGDQFTGSAKEAYSEEAAKIQRQWDNQAD